MANNPLVDQGTLSRLRSNVVISDFPSLNVIAPNLGKEGIKLALQGESTTYLPTMTGGVVSQEPYQLCDVTMQLLKSQPLADQYKAKMEDDAKLGAISVRGDSTQLSVYDLVNCSIMGVRELDFGGTDPGYVVSIRGYYNINQNLYG